jgi:hypothetical protein
MKGAIRRTGLKLKDTHLRQIAARCLSQKELEAVWTSQPTARCGVLLKPDGALCAPLLEEDASALPMVPR